MLYFFPAYLTTNNRGTRQNLRLSGYDVEYISKTYPGGSQTPENFYLSVYNEQLKNNMDISDNERDQPSPKKQSKFLFYLIILLLISIVGLILYIFIRH
jgi:ATP-dependent Zn protease